MLQNGESARFLLALLGVLAVIFVFVYFWHSRVYKPGIAAGTTLTDLAFALRKMNSAWTQTSEVSVRGLYKPQSLFTGNVMILVQSNWKGDPSTVQFKLAFGNPDSSTSDEGIYHPPTTLLRLTSRHSFPELAILNKYSKSQIAANSVGTTLGFRSRLKQVHEDLFVYGDSAEDVARLFDPMLLDKILRFPREAFGPAFEGLVISGSEVRLSWEGHETDPKIIQATFQILKTISEAGP